MMLMCHYVSDIFHLLVLCRPSCSGMRSIRTGSWSTSSLWWATVLVWATCGGSRTSAWGMEAELFSSHSSSASSCVDSPCTSWRCPWASLSLWVPTTSGASARCLEVISCMLCLYLFPFLEQQFHLLVCTYTIHHGWKLLFSAFRLQNVFDIHKLEHFFARNETFFWIIKWFKLL